MYKQLLCVLMLVDKPPLDFEADMSEGKGGGRGEKERGMGCGLVDIQNKSNNAV